MRKSLKCALAWALTLVMLFACVPSASAYYSVVTYEGQEVTSRELAKTVAEEGMILLKNEPVAGGEKALPLAKGESVAVFGLSQIDYVYGGGGSGSFITAYAHSLWDGLLAKEEAGEITLYKGLRPKYEAFFTENQGEKDTSAMSTAMPGDQGAVLNAAGEMPLTDEDVAAAAEAADTAIFAIARMSSEGSDYQDAPGNFQLSDVEKQIIAQLKAADFKKVVVILNVPYVIESGWIKDDPEIDAALCVSLPGMEGGDAMADVLLGEAYPSGKTVDTWAYEHKDYPSVKYGTFGEKGMAKYVEDIFVGYRYFETIPGAQEQVAYEFGYGLSYADFTIEDVKLDVTGEGRERSVTVTATVKNSSDKYAGKEVVQVYYGAPEGKLTQPARELAGYAKTGEIAPGASETVTITFPFDDMASYDDLGLTGEEHEAAYVLEAGEYAFYVGNSVRNAAPAGTYALAELEEVEQLSHQLVPDVKELPNRLTADGTLAPLTQTVNAATSTEPGEAIYANPPTSDDPFITFPEVVTALEAGNEDLLRTFVSRMTVDELIESVSASVPKDPYAGHRTGYGGVDIYGYPQFTSTNGAAGIQFNNGNADDPDMNATFFPCGTMQASTWNKALLETVGQAMGLEARRFNMDMWQAPSMNLHRDPLCGRNFEYYSEDPLISGWTAASLSIGTASVSFYAQFKHFAANNQETGRGGSDSQVSERALRELYLKGFEIAIKEGKGASLMSSYNKINGQPCMSSHDLLTEITRNEWGFTGYINTDFLGSMLSGSRHDDEIIGGTDLKAPWCDGEPNVIRASLKSGKLKLWQLQRSAERVIRFAAMTEAGKATLATDFVYDTKLNIDRDDVIVQNDRRAVRIWNEIPAAEFMGAIYGSYNQTYALLDEAGNAAAEDAVVKPGMSLTVTAEDGVTTSTYAIVDADIAANAAVKASSGADAANVIDMDAATAWTGEGWGDWIELDLGADYKLTSLKLDFVDGENTTLGYEVWVKTGEDADWAANTAKDRDFGAEGYTLDFMSTVKNVGTQTTLFTNGLAGRYIAVKLSGGVGSAAIANADVDGFRVVSDVYEIDNATGTIYMPGTLPAHEQLTIEGNGELDVTGFGSSYLLVQVMDNADRNVRLSRKNPQ